MRGGLKDSPPCGRYVGEAEAAGLRAGVWARGEGVGGASPEGSSPFPSPPAALHQPPVHLGLQQV